MANKNEQSALNVNEHLTQSEAFLSKYKKPVIVAALAIIIVVLGFFAYNIYISGPREEKASTALSRGQEYFDQEMFDKALNGDGAGFVGFAKIADDYSGTDAANLANLYAGLCYANMGKWNDAVKYLNEFDPEDDQMISPAAIAALGDAYANVNQLDKAIDAFKKAADMADSKAADNANNSLSPTFLLKAGILLESQNKKDDALKIYQDIKKKYANSALVQSSEIDKYIERASTK
jgi:tetratricopeptide (TPR) repeat protein